MRLDFGKPVHCVDGAFGQLDDVAIEPIAHTVTHLVARPNDLDGVSRLVPIELVDRSSDGQQELRLQCTLDAATQFPSVQEYAYLSLDEVPSEDANWDVGVEEVLETPYAGQLDYSGVDSAYGVIYDRVPKGEVEIRRASGVESTDGDFLGRVNGLIVGSDDRITHVVLERGYFWRRREVIVPLSAVDSVRTDTVTVSLSKKAIGALPSTRVHR